jgi:hypothetical protein
MPKKKMPEARIGQPAPNFKNIAVVDDTPSRIFH